mmetsp:Transcript_62322/g.182047  ORF Transcript_62322/g.182047 Transcript_62322/m.182047 type:complete len:261 (+) Transcript_62322:82-864(+)
MDVSLLPRMVVAWGCLDTGTWIGLVPVRFLPVLIVAIEFSTVSYITMPIPHGTRHVRVLVVLTHTVRIRMEKVEYGLVLPDVAIKVVAMGLHLLHRCVLSDCRAIKCTVLRFIDGGHVAVPGSKAVLRIHVPGLLVLCIPKGVCGLQHVLLLDALNCELKVRRVAPSIWVGMAVGGLCHVLEHALVGFPSAVERRLTRSRQLLAFFFWNSAGLQGKAALEPGLMCLQQGSLTIYPRLMLDKRNLIGNWRASRQMWGCKAE